MLPYTIRFVITLLSVMTEFSGLSNETEHFEHILLAKVFSYPSNDITTFKTNYLRILSLYNKPEYRKYFIKSIDDNNANIRLLSLITLLKNKDIDLKNILIERLHRETQKELQIIITKELTRDFADERTLNELIKVIDNPSITVFEYFLACVSAYNISGDARYLKNISRIIKEADTGEQKIYLSWIQDINDLSFIPVIEVCFPEKNFLHDEADILINELKYTNSACYQLTKSN